jgi:hypothetical protein
MQRRDQPNLIKYQKSGINRAQIFSKDLKVHLANIKRLSFQILENYQRKTEFIDLADENDRHSH